MNKGKPNQYSTYIEVQNIGIGQQEEQATAAVITCGVTQQRPSSHTSHTHPLSFTPRASPYPHPPLRNRLSVSFFLFAFVFCFFFPRTSFLFISHFIRWKKNAHKEALLWGEQGRRESFVSIRMCVNAQTLVSSKLYITFYGSPKGLDIIPHFVVQSLKTTLRFMSV